MEKRKSNGADGGDLRASKRLKTAEDKPSEAAEWTRKKGHEFLEQIRKTGDKSGRRIATHFEALPPRKGNEDYYKRVRMPISLADVEAKLDKNEFASLSELESYIKRMIQNAKEYYPKGSQPFDDAERVRKATSNFMVKNNPAYKQQQGYTAVATPIPDELLASDADEGSAAGAAGEAEEAAAAEEEDNGDEEAAANAEDSDKDAGENGDTKAEAEEEVEDEEEEEGEADEGGEEEEDDDDDDGEEEADEPRSARRKSSSAARSTRDTPSRAGRKSSERAVSVSAKQDYEYEGVPYKGLTFQQAQEKILEEVIRRPDEEDENYAYFEPFLNLPPRSLKDYFQVIKDPLSLKKLQKLVKGIRSRTDRSGVTEYKSWAAFEEKASLLWENAYFYNEDGSAIANMAKELEKMFRDELRQAKEVVPEPPQPKIKIKKAPGVQETPAAGPKKITIHVAQTRGSSAESPVPKTGGSVASDGVGSGNSGSGGAGPRAAAAAAAAAPGNGSNASPSPSVAAAVAATKREASSRASPALSQRPNGATPGLTNGSATPVNGASVAAAGAAGPNGEAAPPAAPPVPRRPAYESKFRERGREPLLTKLSMRTHPAIACDPRFEIEMPPHPKLTQRSVTINIPAGQWRQHLAVSLHPAVHQQQRPFKLFVISNGATLGQTASPPLPPAPAPVPGPAQPAAGANGTASATSPPAADASTKLYEVNLHPGVNVIQVQLIAGVAKSQTLPNGADAELEKVTIFANVLKF